MAPEPHWAMRWSVSPILSMSLTASGSLSPRVRAWRCIESMTSRPDIPPSIIRVSRVSRAFMKSPARAALSIFPVASVAGVSVSLNTRSRSIFFPDDAAAWSMPIARLMSPLEARAMPPAAPSASSIPSRDATSSNLLARTSWGIGLKRTTLHLDFTGSMIIAGWLHERMNAQLPE